MAWSFRVTASGDRGSFPGEIAEIGLRQIRIAKPNLPKQRVAGSIPVSRSRYDFLDLQAETTAPFVEA